jgi:hypothetical protein
MARNQNAYVNRRQAILPSASIFGHPGEQISALAAERQKSNYKEASPYLERRPMRLEEAEIVHRRDR